MIASVELPTIKAFIDLVVGEIWYVNIRWVVSFRKYMREYIHDDCSTAWGMSVLVDNTSGTVL